MGTKSSPPRAPIVTAKAPPPPKSILPEEQRQAWLSMDDIDLLLYLLEKYQSKHRLIDYLKQVRRQFSDNALRLAELEARVRANAFWEKEKGTLPKERKLRKEAKKRHRDAEAMIKCLTPKQMQEVVKELERMPKVEGGIEDEMSALCEKQGNQNGTGSV